MTPWNELDKNMQLALIEQLQEDWPDWDQEERDYSILHDPDRVRAAGLMPDQQKKQALTAVGWIKRLFKK